MHSELLPTYAVAARFLTLLDEEAESFTFQTFDDNADRKDPSLAHVLSGTLDEHWDTLVALNRGGAGVFVTVNKTNGRGRKREDIIQVRALWQEADRGDEPLLPLQPHIEVESSPGKYHRYIRVEGMPIAAFDGHQQRVIQDYGSDPNAGDISRVLRLPGFHHKKVSARKGASGDPFMVRITHESGEQPYRYETVAQALPPATRRHTDRPTGTPAPLSDPEKVRSALHAIDPDCAYVEWLAVGMALHSTGAGEQAYTLWDDWSQQGALYRDGETAYRWQTFTADGGITLGTLFHFAQRAGWDRESFEYARLQQAIAEVDPAAVEQITALIARIQGAQLSTTFTELLVAALSRKTGVSKTALRADLKNRKNAVPTHPELAERFVERHREDTLYTQSAFWMWNVHQQGVWTMVDDRVVRIDIQAICDEHLERKWNKTTIDSVTDITKTCLYRDQHRFNTRPEAINLASGELHLVNGRWEHRPHVREHYFTTQLPITYDPAATAPRFEQFLAEIFNGDPDAAEKCQLLLEGIGYTLMATCQFEVFFLLIGSGANGKSVLLGVVEALAGPAHVSAVQPSQFDNRFQRAHLQGKLANIVTEIAEGAQIADAELKAIVSGELTTAEHKLKPPFDFHPVATMWFGTNHMPHTRDFSDALMRRARILTFNNKFEGEACDPRLADKLTLELPGILNLALDAIAAALARGGFTDCPSDQEARRRWRLETDQVAQFLEERMELDCDATVEVDRLYTTYRFWADDAGIRHPVGKRVFGDRLERLGLQRTRTAEARLIKGLRFPDHSKVERLGQSRRG